MAKNALCIGINRYGGGSDLAGCVNDSQDFAAVLTERGFEVAMLLDKDATGANMRDGIRQLIASMAEGDTAVIQYSGHGSYVPDENSDEPDGVDESICPVDIFTKGEITDDEIWMLTSKRPANSKVIFISDSCHSGTVSRFAPGRSEQTRKVKFLPPASFLAARYLSKLRGIGYRWSVPVGRHAGLLLSGCSDPEYSYDAYFSDRPNGAFTYYALQTLKKLPVKSSYQRWHTAIRKVLPSQEYPQSPNLYGSSSMRRWHIFA